jgi:hypothetical protein
MILTTEPTGPIDTGDDCEEVPAEWKATVNTAPLSLGGQTFVGVDLPVFVITVKGNLREHREEHLEQPYAARKMRTAPVESFKVARLTPTTNQP